MSVNKLKIFNISIQILLGLIFLVSAILKVVSYRIFQESLMSFGFINNIYIEYVALSIIFIEILIGLAIISSIFTNLTLILALLLLNTFEVIAIYSVLFDKNWICACFGSILLGTFSLSSIVRDAFIILLVIYVYLFRVKDYCYKNFPNTITISLVLSFGLLSILLLRPMFDSSNKISLQLGDELKDIKMLSINNQLINTSKRNKALIMYIIFNPERDCMSCLTEYPLWNKIYEEFSGEIEVIGIANARDSNFIKIWKNVRNIRFDVILDPDNQIFENYYISTPMKILVDSLNKTILLDKSSDNPIQQETFFLEVQKFVSLIKTIPIH